MTRREKVRGGSRKRGYWWCWQKPRGAHPKAGASSQVSRILYFPNSSNSSGFYFPWLYSIQGVFSEHPCYVILSTALDATGPGKWCQSKERAGVCLWGACGHSEMAVSTVGWWNQVEASGMLPKWEALWEAEKEGFDINEYSSIHSSLCSNLFRLYCRNTYK